MIFRSALNIFMNWASQRDTEISRNWIDLKMASEPIKTFKILCKIKHIETTISMRATAQCSKAGSCVVLIIREIKLILNEH